MSTQPLTNVDETTSNNIKSDELPQSKEAIKLIKGNKNISG